MKNLIKVFSLICIVSLSSCYRSSGAGADLVLGTTLWLLLGLEVEQNDQYTNDDTFQAPTDSPIVKSNQPDLKFEFAQNGEHYTTNLNTLERVYLGSWEMDEKLTVTSKENTKLQVNFNIIKLDEEEMILELEESKDNLEKFNAIYDLKITDVNKRFTFSKF